MMDAMIERIDAAARILVWATLAIVGWFAISYGLVVISGVLLHDPAALDAGLILSGVSDVSNQFITLNMLTNNVIIGAAALVAGAVFASRRYPQDTPGAAIAEPAALLVGGALATIGQPLVLGIISSLLIGRL